MATFPFLRFQAPQYYLLAMAQISTSPLININHLKAKSLENNIAGYCSPFIDIPYQYFFVCPLRLVSQCGKLQRVSTKQSIFEWPGLSGLVSVEKFADCEQETNLAKLKVIIVKVD